MALTPEQQRRAEEAVREAEMERAIKLGEELAKKLRHGPKEDRK